MRAKDAILPAVLVFLLLAAGCVDGKKPPAIAKNNSANFTPHVPAQPPKEPLNCSDGTRRGECSEFKPYFCEHGELVYNATECGCFPYQMLEGTMCRNALECNDSTKHGSCSADKPLFCYDGVLTENASVCGCPERYVQEDEGCRWKSNCDDGTQDKSCSENKPYYCFNGTLAEKAARCGCFEGFQKSGESCANPYPPDSYETYSWKFRSKSYAVKLGFSSKLVNYYLKAPRTYLCHGSCPGWETEYYKMFVLDGKQAILINELIRQPNAGAGDEKLLVLMAFVQSIPYDWSTYYSGAWPQKYPYETAYYDAGLCGDKSLLAAAIASELGYGVALFSYKPEKHMALGIKCPRNVSNYDSGYCFLETTLNCSRLTYNKGNYTGSGELKSTPEIYVISEGGELDYASVMKHINEIEEYENALARMDELEKLIRGASNANKQYEYAEEHDSIYESVYLPYVTCE